MAKRLFYSGDVNIEHGGFFYDLSTFDDLGYVSACRVTPCSDAGDGAPDNAYWVETISVNTGDKDAIKLAYSGVGDDVQTRRAHRALHDPNLGSLSALIMRIEQALDCSGWDHQLAQWDKLTWAQKRHAVVEACVGYGYTDTDQQWCVAIGPVTEAQAKRWRIDTHLKANASLRRFARGKL